MALVRPRPEVREGRVTGSLSREVATFVTNQTQFQHRRRRPPKTGIPSPAPPRAGRVYLAATASAPRAIPARYRPGEAHTKTAGECCVHYITSSNPTIPNLSLPRLRARVRRQGYRIAHDHYASTFSLMNGRLRGPLHGLDHVGLGDIANAIDGALYSSLIRTPNRSAFVLMKLINRDPPAIAGAI